MSHRTHEESSNLGGNKLDGEWCCTPSKLEHSTTTTTMLPQPMPPQIGHRHRHRPKAISDECMPQIRNTTIYSSSPGVVENRSDIVLALFHVFGRSVWTTSATFKLYQQIRKKKKKQVTSLPSSPPKSCLLRTRTRMVTTNNTVTQHHHRRPHRHQDPPSQLPRP